MLSACRQLPICGSTEQSVLEATFFPPIPPCPQGALGVKGAPRGCDFHCSSCVYNLASLCLALGTYIPHQRNRPLSKLLNL